MTALYAIIAAAAIEAALFAAVALLRPHFQWLITTADITPAIPAGKVDKFMSTSFHETLGWLHRPNMTWENETENGPVSYHTDSQGRRRNPGFEDQPTRVAVYGDSYAFCRLTNDDEAWPHLLSRELGVHVGNYGVGNYGLDQAYLRYAMEPPEEADVVVMAVVPETIARIQSYWKHYFEYGNVLAFKPRFVLDGGGLRRLECPVRSGKDFLILAETAGALRHIQDNDGFFHRKFMPDVLRFPYVWRIAVRPGRHLPILWHLISGVLRNDFGSGWRRAFGVVLAENSRWTRRLFSEPEARDLMRAVVEAFACECRDNGQRPMLVVLPQPLDVEDGIHGEQADFFRSLESVLPVVDFTREFMGKDRRYFFVEGPLGPHTSRMANRYIAAALARRLGFFDDIAAADEARPQNEELKL